MFPYRVDKNEPTIDVNGIAAQLIENDTETLIVWNWVPEQLSRGFLILQLHAAKEVPVSELALMARSISY